jgi:hypothetical protein
MHFPFSVHRFPACEIALFAHHRHRTRACVARGRFFLSVKYGWQSWHGMGIDGSDSATPIVSLSILQS